MSDLESRLARHLAAELDGLHGPEPAWSTFVSARSPGVSRPLAGGSVASGGVAARRPLRLAAVAALAAALVIAVGAIVVRGPDRGGPIASPSPAGSAVAPPSPSASASVAASAGVPPTPSPTRPTPTRAVGKAWSRLPAYEVLRSVGMLSPQVGWVATAVDLRVTEDGGATWRIATPPGRFLDSMYWAFTFAPGGHGLAVGCPQTCEELALWQTRDLGRTWTRSDELSSVPGMSEGSLLLQRLADNHVVLQVAEPLRVLPATTSLYVSDDGGDTWLGPRTSPGGLLGGNGNAPAPDYGEAALVAMSTSVGQPVEVSVSLDDGLSWVTAALTGTDDTSVVKAARMFDASTGVVAVQSTFSPRPANTLTFYRTSDGGRSWTVATNVDGRVATAVQLAGPSAWWVVRTPLGPDRATWAIESALTSDAGATWTTRQTLRAAYLEGHAQAFGDDGSAWLTFTAFCAKCQGPPDVGKSYEILGTSDWGATWQPITPRH